MTMSSLSREGTGHRGLNVLKPCIALSFLLYAVWLQLRGSDGQIQGAKTEIFSEEHVQTQWAKKENLSQFIQNSSAETDQNLNNFTLHEMKLLQNYTGRLEQLWKCSDDNSSSGGPRKLLLFIHIFKTAGSTFRRFFFDFYGRFCNKGVVVITGCSRVSEASWSSGPDKVWGHKGRDGPGTECVNKRTRTRQDQVINVEGNMTGFLVEKHGDIVIGHLSLGLHEYFEQGWQVSMVVDNKNQEDISKPATKVALQYQYVTFFRDPVAKFVSGRVFANRNLQWTLQEAVQFIKAGILNDVAKNVYYNGFGKYLTTPKQKEQYLSKEKLIEAIETNLVSHNVMIGVVERMGDSLALLQSIIDEDAELTDTMLMLASDKSSAAIRNNNTFVVNKSKLSTSTIVARLREDTDVWPKLQEYLKFELQLYNFAVKLHLKQISFLKQHLHG